MAQYLTLSPGTEESSSTSNHLPLAFSLHEAAAHLNSKNGQEPGTLYLLKLSVSLALCHLLNARGPFKYTAHEELQDLFCIAAACWPVRRPFKKHRALYLKMVHACPLQQPKGLGISSDELDALILCTARLLALVDASTGDASTGSA